jgi:hypothetical protein
MSDRIPNHDKSAPENSQIQQSRSDMTSVAIGPLVSTPPLKNRTARDPKICPTDDEAIIPKSATSTKFNKQSWNYIIRSGVAGGLAGCAVSFSPHIDDHAS